MSLGERIRELREARNWTQSELSKRARIAISAISYFESGQRNPSAEALIKLADAFGVPTDLILGQAIAGETELESSMEFQTMYRRLKVLPKERQARTLHMLNQVLDATEDLGK